MIQRSPFEPTAEARAARVRALREASRRLVRELGFLRDALAGTALPPSAVHALLEIDACGTLTAGALADRLGLEKSSVSRMLRKLVDSGEVAEGIGAADGRTKPLTLTPGGRAAVAGIHAFADRQVSEALERLDPRAQRIAAEGLRLYADALVADRTVADARPAVTIETGYRTGALARCAGLHARYYARLAGFGRPFEALVAAGLAEFSGRLDRSGNDL